MFQIKWKIILALILLLIQSMITCFSLFYKILRFLVFDNIIFALVSDEVIKFDNNIDPSSIIE